MFNLFKKKPEEKKEPAKKQECTGDPSCPMCHIGDDTLKTLEKEADRNAQDGNEN